MPGIFLLVAFLVARWSLSHKHRNALGRVISIQQPIVEGRDISNWAIAGGETVTIAKALYRLSQIDSGVLESIQTSHGANAFESYSDLASSVDKLCERGPKALDGAVARYKGYLGEQVLAEHLRDSGHFVELASSPNQEGWDAVLDGHVVQFKAGLHRGPIDEHLERFPDIPVVTVAEHSESFANHEQVVVIEQISGEALEESTRQTLEGIDGLDDFDCAFPIITAVISGGKNVQLLVNGETGIWTALENTGADIAGVGLGGAAGAKAGALIGSVGGPLGVVVGVSVGGFLGALGGRSLMNDFKERHLREAQEEMNEVIEEYPEAYAEALVAKAEAREEYALGIKPRGIRAIFWPSFSDSVRRSVAKRHLLQASNDFAEASDIFSEVSDAEELDDFRKIGIELIEQEQDEEFQAVFSPMLQLLRQRLKASMEKVATERRKLGHFK